MRRSHTLISATVALLFLAGCETTGLLGGAQSAPKESLVEAVEEESQNEVEREEEGVEKEEKEPFVPEKNVKLDWVFEGDDPIHWSGALSNRRFELSAIGISDKRSTRWDQKAEAGVLTLSSQKGNITVEIREHLCHVADKSQPYSVTIRTEKDELKGCALNQGTAFDRYVPPAPEIEEKEVVEAEVKTPQKAAIPNPNVPKEGFRVPKNATNLDIVFSGNSPHWLASLKGRAFEFNSSSESISESRRLSWQGSNQNGTARISSPDGTIVIALSPNRCNGSGYQTTLTLGGKTFKGCGVVN